MRPTGDIPDGNLCLKIPRENWGRVSDSPLIFFYTFKEKEEGLSLPHNSLKNSSPPLCLQDLLSYPKVTIFVKYVIIGKDGPEGHLKRPLHRQAHLQRLESLADRGQLFLAGPSPIRPEALW